MRRSRDVRTQEPEMNVAITQPDETAMAPALHQLVDEFLTEPLGFAPGEVVPAAQERFGAEISDEALADVETVGDFGRCLGEAIARRDRRDGP
jgi:hypothetical protein